MIAYGLLVHWTPITKLPLLKIGDEKAMRRLQRRRGICPHIPGDEAFFFRIYKCGGFQRERRVSYEEREQTKG